MAAADIPEEQLKLFSVFHKPYFIPPVPYLQPVQAGKALSSQSLPMITDDEGENISALNPKMCELTVLYNIWKNNRYQPAEYWGLCHYRRYFTLNIHWTGIKKKKLYYLSDIGKNFRKVFSPKLEKFLRKTLTPATVVLPSYVIIERTEDKTGGFWSLKDHFCRDHDPMAWEAAEKAVKELYPEYLNSFSAAGNAAPFYPYNMMIAHHTMWDKYLQWLFDIAFHINRHYIFPADTYQMRAIAFLAERLLTIYMYHHRNHYTIVHLPVAYFRD